VKVFKVLGMWAVLAGILPAAEAAPPPQALQPIEGKVVWVDFWASWCVPCRRSFPWMNTMHEKYKDRGLQIIAVNLDRDRKAADGFLTEVPAQFALRFDPAGDLAKTFEVQAMPSSFLMDASGNILARHFGFKMSDAEEYERGIEAALAAAKARP
jgi:cytochrome c biogenesis protein CcmG/thiol:disulfide interchange protein DsbE